MNAVMKAIEDQPRILFIDDEERILRSMKALFRRNYDVITTTDPTEALDILSNQDIDVIVSDQRMPDITGIELLKQVTQLSPRTIRVLLTGYADMKATLDAINEGEVFRYLKKPWNNEELQRILAEASDIARNSSYHEVSEEAMIADSKGAGVLIIDDDPAAQSSIKSLVENMFPVYCCANMEGAVDILEQQEIGVIISETRIGGGDLTGLITFLKQTHPHIVTIVASQHSDAGIAIRLINQGQIYRFLPKPLTAGLLTPSASSAMKRYMSFKQNPEITQRYKVEATAPAETEAALPSGFLARIKAMKKRWFIFGGRG